MNRCFIMPGMGMYIYIYISTWLLGTIRSFMFLTGTLKYGPDHCKLADTQQVKKRVEKQIYLSHLYPHTVGLKLSLCTCPILLILHLLPITVQMSCYRLHSLENPGTTQNWYIGRVHFKEFSHHPVYLYISNINKMLNSTGISQAQFENFWIHQTLEADRLSWSLLFAQAICKDSSQPHSQISTS